MSRPPNILLITSDQHHFSALGAVNPRIQTPALDRLCREGTRFDRAYCNNPVCSPSRATMITGLYPSAHHCWTIGVKLPEDVPTVGELLHRRGYDTALIGKAHFQPLASAPGSESLECQPVLRDLEFWRQFHGPWYGFQHVELARNHTDESHVGQHYALWLEERGLRNWRDYFEAWPRDPGAPRRRHTWELPAEYHYSAWTAERSIAQIEQSVAGDRPFFLWSSFHDPHPSYLAPRPWDTRYRPEDMQPGRYVEGEFDHMPPHFRMTRDPGADWSVYQEPGGSWCHGCHAHRQDEAALRRDMAVYYGMVSLLDQQVGRILATLDRLGIAANTLVVFSTDHGHFLGQHGLVAKGPFHYEDMLRVPFIVRQPGVVPAGRVSESLQALIDLPESFLAAAGAPVPGAMQGVNQLPVWSGQQAAARAEVIVENRHQPTTLHLRTYIDRRYKLTVYRDRPSGELFDLQEDPGELRNRWDDAGYAAVKAELFQRALNAEIRREPTRMPRIAGA